MKESRLMHTPLRTMLSLATALCLATPLAQACPKQLPDGLSGTVVGRDLLVAGLSSHITQVESGLAVGELLNRTEKTWKDAGYDVKRNTAAGWQIVSALSDDCIASLQLAERAKAFGYFAVSKLAPGGAVTPQSLGVPVPGDAKVTSSVISDDDGRKGVTMSMTSARSMEDLSRFFAERLAAGKWTAIRSHRIDGAKSGVSTMIVNAQRERTRIEIVIWKEGQAQIVLTLAPTI